jgi:hypothetical protein
VSPAELLGAGLVLVAAVAVGTIAHELSHAVALRAFGVPYELEWLPARDGAGLLRASVSGGWARVKPRGIPRGLSPWSLRTAALMPLLMSTPLALAALGVVPDPLRTGDPYLSAAAIGWLACALPSPQDFSLFWYAERVIARRVRERERRAGRR